MLFGADLLLLGFGFFGLGLLLLARLDFLQFVLDVALLYLKLLFFFLEFLFGRGLGLLPKLPLFLEEFGKLLFLFLEGLGVLGLGFGF